MYDRGSVEVWWTSCSETPLEPLEAGQFFAVLTKTLFTSSMLNSTQDMNTRTVLPLSPTRTASVWWTNHVDTPIAALWQILIIILYTMWYMSSQYCETGTLSHNSIQSCAGSDRIIDGVISLMAYRWGSKCK